MRLDQSRAGSARFSENGQCGIELFGDIKPIGICGGGSKRTAISITMICHVYAGPIPKSWLGSRSNPNYAVAICAAIIVKTTE